MAANGLTLTREDQMRLGRALFEAQERMMPEGEIWDDLSDGDKSFWFNSVGYVLHELKNLVTERAGKP
jgi:hypothetical protein